MSSEDHQRTREVDDDIDLAAYIVVLWRNRWLVFSSMCLFAALVAGVGLISPRQYEAIATLSLAQSPPDQGAPVTTSSVRTSILNETVAGAIVRDLKLDTMPHPVSTDTFLNGVLTVDEVRNTNLIQVRVRLPDPALAANAANAIAEKALESAGQLRKKEAVEILNLLKKRMDEAAARLADAEQSMEESRVGFADLERTRPAEVTGPTSAKRSNQSEYARRQADVSRKEIDYDVARRTYEDVSAQYQMAHLRLAAGLPGLQMTGPATPQSSPVPRRLLLRSVMGGVAGAVIGVLAAFARETVAQRRRRAQISASDPRAPRL